MIFLPMLTTYRNDRGLHEYVPEVFRRMVNEELQEVLDAKTWNHRVEEMCDVCVLCFNAVAQQGGDMKALLSYRNSPVYKDVIYSVELAKDAINVGLINFVRNIMRDCITLNGYDFELAMVETCKKILSREGEMNHDTGKWEKNINQDKSTLYIPDYDKCKIKGE